VKSTQQHIAHLEAELVVLKRRQEVEQSAGHVDNVYIRLRVDDTNRGNFDKVQHAICVEGKAVRNVSDPKHEHFVTGNAKNWVANAGGIRAFKDMFIAGGNDTSWTFAAHVTPNVYTVDIPTMVSDYLYERGETASAFRTQMFLVETGSHDGTPFGVVVKPNGTRYVVGDLLGKGKVQSFKHTSRPYKDVDTATKGHRAKVEILVFDPVG
jgi:hypothetical protein